MTSKPRIAVIGAGLSGVRCASLLRDAADVHVFEKSRGFGGRMAVRRAHGFNFDHGAQYFTAHGTVFRQFLTPFLASGDVQTWEPRLVRLRGEASAPAPNWTAPRYVAQPGMNVLAKKAAAGLDVHRGTQITQIAAKDGTWALHSSEGAVSGGFDWVLSTAPPQQSAKLLPPEFCDHAELQKARMQGCYTLMLGFQQGLDLAWDAALIDQGPLSWIASSASKPGRGSACAIVCQSSNDWADDNLERDQAEVRDALMRAFSDVTGVDADLVDHVDLHRWRYAKVADPSHQPFLVDRDRGLGAAGDWCGAGRVEAAFDSATSLAEAVLLEIS